MDFRAAWRLVEPSVVGLGFELGPRAEIIGTGFLVEPSDPGGRLANLIPILTNNHVVRVLVRGEPPQLLPEAAAFFFVPGTGASEDGETVAMTWRSRVTLHGVGHLPPPAPVGRVPELIGIETREVVVHEPADLAMLLANRVEVQRIARTPVRLRETAVEVGMPVGLLGYPLGVSLRERMPANEVQLTPLLQAGVLSGILPSPNTPFPLHFVADIHAHPGCSGSPVFDEEGEIIGVASAHRFHRSLVRDETGNPLGSHVREASSQLMVVPLSRLPKEFFDALMQSQQ